MELIPIGHIESPFGTKFGVPRQPGLLPRSLSWLILDDPPAQQELLSELHIDDHVMLLWCFSHNIQDGEEWSKTIRPPLLGGTKRVGVFASRSSFRPNALAISRVRIANVELDGISFLGGDLVSGTPVFQIIPYDENVLSFPDASEGWRASTLWPVMDSVTIPRRELEKLPCELREDVRQLLRQDPRPAYTRHGQEERVFWVQYDEHVIWFMVDERDLVVTRIQHLNPDELAHIQRTGNLPTSLSEATHMKKLEYRR